MHYDIFPAEKPLEVESMDYSLVGDNVGDYYAHCELCGYWVETLNEDDEDPTWNIHVIDRNYANEDYHYSDFTEETVYDKESAKASVEKWAAKHTPETCLAAQEETKKEYEDLEKEEEFIYNTYKDLNFLRSVKLKALKNQ